FCGRNRQIPSKPILKKRYRFFIIAFSPLVSVHGRLRWGERRAKCKDYFLGMAFAHPLLGDSTTCSAAKALSLLPCLLCARVQGMASIVDAPEYPCLLTKGHFRELLGNCSAAAPPTQMRHQLKKKKEQSRPSPQRNSISSY